MKLSRLLATLALAAAVLAAPTSAAADIDPKLERPLAPEALSDVCTLFKGDYIEDRLGASCGIIDGTIRCEEICGYSPVADLRELPPMYEPCDLVMGTWREIVVGVVSCELEDTVVVIDCPQEYELEPWWAFPRPVVCEIYSEQPMS